ncbi:MAG: hypothetical protein VX546_14965 [Myxococcota bacterium]|nr:hypothetical protein [Myxococcota bacterium]
MNLINHWATALVFAALAVGSSAAAEDLLDTGDAGVEISRDASDLPREFQPRPPEDADVADTALVFTNEGVTPMRVRCVGFNKNGRIVGRAWVGVPKLGLRYLLASDLSNGRDFVGQVQCAAPPQIRGSAVLLGQNVTDLPVVQTGDTFGRLRFPVVATY